VTLLEPDVALTDFGLTIECLGLAAWLHWRTPMNPLRTCFVIFFAALGIAALLGGITHGFLDDPRSTLYGLTRGVTLLAIGIAGVATWMIGALLFSERTAKRVLVVAGLLFIVYAATILWISRSFTVAIITYVPAVALLLLAFALTYRRRPSTYLKVGIVGLVLSFVAAAIQQAEIRAPGLTHNALYHLVQAVAMLMIFAAARGLTREATCEHDATS
jgi:uncharacterized protein DUF6962